MSDLLDSSEIDEASVDCTRGRELGCATFCCRLVVRLQAGEVPPDGDVGSSKRCVDKDPATGWCVYLDLADYSCAVWSKRPAVCRAYDCNRDPLLQVVLQHGFVSLTSLVKARRSPHTPRLSVPHRRR